MLGVSRAGGSARVVLVLLLLSSAMLPFIQPVFAATYNVTVVMDSGDHNAGCRAVIDGVPYGNNAVASLTAGVHTLVAYTPSNWGFLMWGDTVNADVADLNNPSTTLTVIGNGVIMGDWGPVVTFYSSPAGGGTISVYYYGAGTPFTETYSNGQSGVIKGWSSELRANPSSGYGFSSWQTTGSVSVNTPSSTPTYWNHNGPGTVTANFQVQPSIALTSDGTDGTHNTGTITFAGVPCSLPASVSKTAGSYPITGNPPSGYRFQGWRSGQGVSVTDSGAQSTTTIVSGNGWLEAVWYPLGRYPILLVTATTDGQTNVGSITVNGTGRSPETIVWMGPGPSSITGNPPSGYVFDHWETSGYVGVVNPNSQSSTASATGSGTLKAWFKLPSSTLSVVVTANPSSITTSQSSTITVTVTSGGSAVSGASVSLSSNGGTLNPTSGTTNANGQFTSSFSSSSTGTFTIDASASKSPYTPGSGNCQVTVTTQPIDTGNLQVYVKEQGTNNPIAGASVGSTSQPNGQSSLSGTTDSIGSVTFNGIRTGSYTIQTGKTGYQSGSSPATVNKDQTTIITIYLASVSQTGTLSVDTTPVKGEVFVSGLSWGIAPQSRTVQIGTYTVSFGSMTGYSIPAAQSATVYQDQVTSIVGTYVAISQFDFKVEVSPSSKSVTGGETAIYTVTVSLTGGSTQSVSLELSGLPQSISYGFVNPSGSPSFTTELRVYTDQEDPSATYTLTITARGGGISRYATTTLEIKSAWKGSYVETYYVSRTYSIWGLSLNVGAKIAELHISREDAVASGTALYVLCVQTLAGVGEEVSGYLPRFGDLFNLVFKAIGEAVGGNPDGSYDFTCIEVYSGWGWLYAGSISAGTGFPIALTLGIPIPIAFFGLPTPSSRRLYFTSSIPATQILSAAGSIARTVVALTDPQGRLYLHVYDAAGHHVGIEYNTNQSETNIPDSVYVEWNMITVVFLPSTVREFRCVVDACRAHLPIENYLLGVADYRNNTTTTAFTKNSTIAQGQTHDYGISLVSGLVPNVNRLPNIDWVDIPRTVVLGSTLTARVNVTDDIGVAKVTLMVLTSGGGRNYTMLGSRGTYSLNLAASDLGIGQYRVLIEAADTNGGMTRSPESPLTVLGRLYFSGKTDVLEVVQGGMATISIDLKDQAGEIIEFAAVSVRLGVGTYNASYRGAGNYQVSIDTRGLAEGNYNMTISAEKELHQPETTQMVLVVRSWWWPYLPYMVAVVPIAGYSVYRMTRKKKKEVIVVPPEPIGLLAEAVRMMEQEDYGEATKYTAHTLRSNLTRALNLSESLTADELIKKVQDTRKDLDPERLRYVLQLGERSTFARYRPRKDEAEKALRYSQELLELLKK